MEALIRYNKLLFDLSIILFPPLKTRHVLLHLAALEGIELYCHSHLPRATTVSALKALGLLEYFDDILFEDESVEGALEICSADVANYPALAPSLKRSRARPYHLTLDLF